MSASIERNLTRVVLPDDPQLVTRYKNAVNLFLTFGLFTAPEIWAFFPIPPIDAGVEPDDFECLHRFVEPGEAQSHE